MLLAIGTVALTFGSFFFVTVPHSEHYQAISQTDRVRRDSNPLHRTRPSWNKFGKGSRAPPAEPSESLSLSFVPPASSEEQLPTRSHHTASSKDEEDRPASGASTPKRRDTEASSSETASLLSDESSVPGDIIDNKPHEHDPEGHAHSHNGRPDISGFSLLRYTEFYSLWIMLGILTGIGLMTINNIGNNVQALWYNDPSEPDAAFIMKRQLMHVSIISVFSFFGRLLSGVGSDFLVKNLGMSRFWCLVASSCIFMLAQISGLKITSPHYLWILSSVSGLGYGALFGVYPALVADTFGVSGLSVNWGFMTLAPVIFGNIFNLAYGGIYDSHSVPSDKEEGHMVCEQGVQCYRAAYVFTFFSSIVGIGCALWCIWHEGYLRRKREREADSDHHA